MSCFRFSLSLREYRLVAGEVSDVWRVAAGGSARGSAGRWQHRGSVAEQRHSGPRELAFRLVGFRRRWQCVLADWRRGQSRCWASWRRGSCWLAAPRVQAAGQRGPDSERHRSTQTTRVPHVRCSRVLTSGFHAFCAACRVLQEELGSLEQSPKLIEGSALLCASNHEWPCSSGIELIVSKQWKAIEDLKLDSEWREPLERALVCSCSLHWQRGC